VATAEVIEAVAWLAFAGCLLALIVYVLLSLPEPEPPTAPPSNLPQAVRRVWYFARRTNVARGLLRGWLVFSFFWSAVVIWAAPFPLPLYFNRVIWPQPIACSHYWRGPCLLGISFNSGRGVCLLILMPWLLAAAIAGGFWVRHGFGTR
jgi:hypothetical protein